MRTCHVARGRCLIFCSTRCFRCGDPACLSCTVKMSYIRYGHKRICLNCLDDMARFGDLDYLTLSVQ